MRRITAIAASLALAACTTSPAPATSGPVPLSYGDAATFEPLVAMSSAGASCVQPAEAHLPSGARSVAMRYAGPPERQVTVTLDAEGTPIRYLDVRGDLTEADGDARDRTTIGLFLEQGYAVLSNRRAADTPSMLEVPLDDLVASPRLGNPEAVMAQVLDRCVEVN